MELPKNITQIGESDRHCKIYVEDYVVSYIKQMNQMVSDHIAAGDSITIVYFEESPIYN